jgi:hypothetical protein
MYDHVYLNESLVMGIVHIIFSNYHFIVNVPPKLLIMSMSFLMTKIPFIKLFKFKRN